MHAPNPLRSLFDIFGRSPESHVDGVNRRAFERLVELLDADGALRGRCVLLRAPRAGFGKTHLLSLVARHFGPSHEFVLLTLADGSRMHPGSVLEDLLRRLCRPLPAGGGLTELDLVARRILAMALEPLVRSGEVPCQDRESAVVALRDRATETFDFHHPNAVTAHWARDNFGVLGPRLGLELSQRVGAPLRESVGWVEALYRFAATPVDQPARIGALIEAAVGGASVDRLGALLQMLTALRRVVLVVDEIEGLSSDPESALRLAAFITSLRQAAESVDVVIALNRDLWESAFRPRLSGGLEDRLAEWVIELEPMSEEEMVALIDSRVPGRGMELVSQIDLEWDDCYARNVLRRAADLWDGIILKEPVSSTSGVSSAVAAASVHPVEGLVGPGVEAGRVEAAERPVIAGDDGEATAFSTVEESGGGSGAGDWHPPVWAESAASGTLAEPGGETAEKPGDEWEAPIAAAAAVGDADGSDGGASDEMEELDEPGGLSPDAPPAPRLAAWIPEPQPPAPRVIEPSPFVAVREWPDEPGEVSAAVPAQADDAVDKPEEVSRAAEVDEPEWHMPSDAPKAAEEDAPAAGPQSPGLDWAAPSVGFGLAVEEARPPHADDASQAREVAPPPAPAPSEPVVQAPAGGESDRVDELLRQFRERYGRR